MMLALLFSLRGGACLYQGEELGLPEAEVPFERLADPYGLAFWPEFKGRDGCRTPMPWTSAASDIPPPHAALAVEVQEADSASLLNTTRRLLRWRKQHPALGEGSLVPLDLGAGLVAFERVAGEDRVLCVFNPGPEAARLVLPDGRRPAEGTGFRVEAEWLLLDGWGAALLV
jgi:alpha-glucosidase